MSILASLTADSSIATDKDSLGGNAALDSGLYLFTVNMAYINKAASGALGLVLHLKTDDNREVRQTLWMTSGTAKGCKNFYEKDGEKHFLPGFTHANNLCLLTVGKEVSAMEPETKVIKLYSSEAKAEVPTKAEVLTELLGKQIVVGLLKQKVDKTAKNAEGVYMPTGETREENEIDKLFRAADRMTAAEIRAQAAEAAFAFTWETKFAGTVRDRSKGVTAGAMPGIPMMANAGAAKKPTTSLFG